MKGIDYSNSVVFKLYCKDPTVKIIYLGTTTNVVQKQRHLENKVRESNLYCYQLIRMLGGINNWVFQVIDRYACSSKKELNAREKEIYNNLEYQNRLNETNLHILGLNGDMYTSPLEKVRCMDCGAVILKTNIKKHKKSIKHKQAFTSLMKIYF